ncbi:MAG: hypothetical protein ACOVOV_01785, partial [Dolichospermum sp.]
SIVGSVSGGATAGLVNGLGFSIMNGTNIGNGAINGFITGASGGMVNGALGGVLGAVSGGATSGYLGAKLTGASNNEAFNSALIGGATGFASYSFSTIINYQNYEGNLNLIGYARIQGAIQRSMFWETESGWFETSNGGVKGIRYGRPFGGL